MAITKATASAPCPLFAGTEQRTAKTGWTMALPYKTYLTCEVSNIASEKGLYSIFNYDLAEYVYNQAADVRGFVVYCETGAYTASITTTKTMFAADFFIKQTHEYAGYGYPQKHNADIRAVSMRVDIANNLEGVATGAYIGVQFREIDSGMTIGGYYLAATPTYGVIGLEVRTEAKDGGAGTGGITVGHANYGVVGILIAQKNDAVFTGAYAAIAIHTPYEGSDSIVGVTCGIRFDNDGLWDGTGFDYCIKFNVECPLGYVMVGVSDASLQDAGEIANETSWAGIGMFALITGASGRKSHAYDEDHGINVVLHQDGEVMFGFGGQFRYRIKDGGVALEAFGVASRLRIADGGTVGEGAGQAIGGFFEVDMVSGATLSLGGGGIAAGVRAVYDDNGATWTTYGKRCAISCEWEDGTADCALYILKHAGAESGGHIIEINDPAHDATDLLKITGATDCGTQVLTFYTDGHDADASLKIVIAGTTYYLPAYATRHTS